jgi:hypothetical protein
MALTQQEINKCIQNLKNNTKQTYYNAKLSKHQAVDILNAINNDYEARRATVKTAMDTASGTTLTTAQAKSFGKAWLQMKWGGE